VSDTLTEVPAVEKTVVEETPALAAEAPKPVEAATPAPAEKPAADKTAEAEKPAAAEKPTPAEKPAAAEKPKATRAKSTAKKTRTVELTLTVTGTAEGEWQADLVHGTQRVVSGLVISAIAVAKAAKELHEDIAEGIETVLEAARDQHRTRMEELEAELARVKAQLAELSE
jgi:outer membrane biosynthesis protein TonB